MFSSLDRHRLGLSRPSTSYRDIKKVVDARRKACARADEAGPECRAASIALEIRMEC